MFTSRKHTMDLSTTLLELQAGRLELYDVREGHERAERFIPGSRHLPLGQVKARRAGYDAHDVKRGMTAWDQELDHGRKPR